MKKLQKRMGLASTAILVVSMILVFCFASAISISPVQAAVKIKVRVWQSTGVKTQADKTNPIVFWAGEGLYQHIVGSKNIICPDPAHPDGYEVQCSEQPKHVSWKIYIDWTGACWGGKPNCVETWERTQAQKEVWPGTYETTHTHSPEQWEFGFHETAAVGGFWVPVDKFGLLAPYIGLASTIIVATVAAAVYVKRVKRRKRKGITG